MIVPFELQPEFKVISIDGISPLDDNFGPLNTPFTPR